MSAVDYDKSFAVFSTVNNPKENGVNTSAIQTENLIHESGRLQLNTYQSFVQNLMNPRSDLRSLMLVHMTGTGKTITALATATEYVRQYDANAETNSVSSIIVLGFTKDIFKRELLTHPEFTFVNIDEAKDLQNLRLRMHESPAIAEQYESKRKQYQRRLIKRKVKGIYEFYGYKQFANRVINMNDVQHMIQKKLKSEEVTDVLNFDPRVIKEWIQSGDVRINTDFIKTISRSLIICDEVHNLYTYETLNTYGLAIQCVFDYFFKTIPTTDINYGCIRSLLLSATPLTSSAAEIIPITTLLTGEEVKYDSLFSLIDGVDQLTSAGIAKIRHMISGRISYIMDDNPKEYPMSIFEGETIRGIDYLRFIRTTPISNQLKSLEQWKERSVNLSEDRGTNMSKDITFPATSVAPFGTFFSKSISALAQLPDATAVRRSADGMLTSNIFKLAELKKYSSKYSRLIQMCLDMKDLKHGKMFIYHPLVQGSGTDLIISILIANGFVLDGDNPVSDSICMLCSVPFSLHKKKSNNHNYTPVRFTYINGSLSKTTVANRLNAFNSDVNVNGEKLKIIVGSRAMRESHTLNACRHVVIAHEPGSISEMIQIIGRAVRKHVHAMLPEDMRSVRIYVLTTNVSEIKYAADDPAANEELAYKTKVLSYIQISRVERIMYDVSIDYLINFRFKLQETPPLLGEAYPIDENAYSQYKQVLTRAYADLRNGNAPYGLHTTRFNVFYLENEARLTIMIIKRILLDFQPLITIASLQTLIREPPFHVEYNTNLISDEAIAMAIQRITFTPDQLRIKITTGKMSLVDSLFDQSSSLVDHNGRDCKIVCIGSPLCSDSCLTIRTVAAILEGDESIIDSYRQVYRIQIDETIDMKELAEKWISFTDINEIWADVKAAYNKGAKLSAVLSKIPIPIHCQLAERVIEKAALCAINRRSVLDFAIVRAVIDFYRSTRLMFIVSDLESTRLYDRYKKLDKDTGSGWWSKNAKPSTASLPIGHTIGDYLRVYQPFEKNWLSLNGIGVGVQEKHPFGYYIYEEQTPGTLHVVLKIRFENDAKAKGITMAFLQRTELEKIASQLKVKLHPKMQKAEIIDLIERAAWQRQAKLYPKRLIYQLIDLYYGGP